MFPFGGRLSNAHNSWGWVKPVAGNALDPSCQCQVLNFLSPLCCFPGNALAGAGNKTLTLRGTGAILMAELNGIAQKRLSFVESYLFETMTEGKNLPCRGSLCRYLQQPWLSQGQDLGAASGFPAGVIGTVHLSHYFRFSNTLSGLELNRE